MPDLLHVCCPSRVHRDQHRALRLQHRAHERPRLRAHDHGHVEHGVHDADLRVQQVRRVREARRDHAGVPLVYPLEQVRPVHRLADVGIHGDLAGADVDSLEGRAPTGQRRAVELERRDVEVVLVVVDLQCFCSNLAAGAQKAAAVVALGSDSDGLVFSQGQAIDVISQLAGQC